MRGRLRIVAASIVALALVGTACNGDDGAPTGERITLRLGAVIPLTGFLADFGPPVQAALELAAEQFEKAAADADFNVEVVVNIEDSQTNPQAGVEAARKLVDTDNVHMIIGAAASSVTIPIAEAVTIPGRVLQITYAATSGDITTLKDNGFVNRTPPSDEHQAPILVDAISEAFDEGATINLGARNDAYGNFLINEVKKRLDAAGFKTNDPVLWADDQPSYDSEANALVSGNPDGWVIIEFPGPYQKISAALVRTGTWDPARTFSADGLKTPNLPLAPPAGSGPEATEGMRGTAPGGTQAFDSLWNSEIGDRVGRGAFDAQAFDAAIIGLVALFKSAVESADGTTPDTVAAKDALRAITAAPGEQFEFTDLADLLRAVADGDEVDYQGASGPVDLDENGDPESIGAFYDVWKIENGQMTTVEVVEVTAGGS